MGFEQSASSLARIKLAHNLLRTIDRTLRWRWIVGAGQG
jgi:hypothetical protein